MKNGYGFTLTPINFPLIPFQKMSSNNNPLLLQDQKQNKTAYTLGQKQFHIQNYIKGKETVLHYSVSHQIPYSTFRGWIKHKDTFLQSNQKFSLNRTRMRESNKSELDDLLYEWYTDMRTRHPLFPITRYALFLQARHLQELLSSSLVQIDDDEPTSENQNQNLMAWTIEL